MSDFSALIQLSATFCAAYVVIGYAESFMKTLSDNVFSFKKRYGDELDKITNLIDLNSMEQLKNKTSFYKDGNVLLCEEVMSDICELRREIEIFTKSIDTKVETHCRIKGFGFVCAYFFLFAITQLLLIGVFSFSPHVLMKYWISLTTLSVLVITFYWLFVFFEFLGKRKWIQRIKEILWRKMEYNANGMALFAVVSLLSISLCFFRISKPCPYVDLIWSSFWVLSVLLPLICFIVCTVTVWIRARKIKKEFCGFKSKKEKTCKEINNRIIKLKYAQETQEEAARKYEEAQEEVVENDV